MINSERDLLNALARAPAGAVIVCAKTLPFGEATLAAEEGRFFVNEHGYAFTLIYKSSNVVSLPHIEPSAGGERYVRRNPEEAAID